MNISLSKGQIAVVDAVDFEWLSQWTWCAEWSKNTQSFYAYRHFRISGKHHRIAMHRLILGLDASDPLRGDHIDGNTLNNTRSNLRPASPIENSRNQKRRFDNTSGFKGVSFSKSRGVWVAQIQVSGKKIFLGHHQTPERAHLAYCEAALLHFGDFARTV